MANLHGKSVAILATNGFEQSELTTPKARLEQAGAHVDIVSPEGGEIRGWKSKDWGDSFRVDKTLEEARIDDYDALVLPGGQINPDLLRVEPRAVSFITDFFRTGKPLAAVCHAPWLLAEAGLLDGRRMTSYHSIRTDMKNAGADWVDEEVVADGNLITSRNPGDLDAFSGAIIDRLGGEAGGRQAQMAS